MTSFRESIVVRTPEGGSISLAVDRAPDICPVCHHAVQPEYLVGVLKGSEFQGTADAVYRCPNFKCESLFLARFVRGMPSPYTPNGFVFKVVWPWTRRAEKFPAEIAELSPRFVEVYNAALGAEESSITDLVGMGLRKALEFLIKDFAIRFNPEREEEIRKAQLMTVINNFCDDPKLKAVATRATWLGNDETHYTRIWVGQDVTDLSPTYS